MRSFQSVSFVGSLLILLCISCSKEKGSDTKFRQYYNQGKNLYVKNCSNCHQKDGSGLGLLYPPINNSDFIDKNYERTLCIIRNGVSGELIVNGKSYNQPMPAMPLLSDLEIAEIATYLYNNWGRSRGIISVQEATRVLSACP